MDAHQNESLAHLVSPDRWAARVRELSAEVKQLRAENEQLHERLRQIVLLAQPMFRATIDEQGP